MSKKIDGYTLTEKMRKTRRRHPLTATEQALYHELVARCNEESWADVFSCSNYDLCGPLQISENTLEKSRVKLIQVGLLHYKSGKSRRVHGQYSFVKRLVIQRTTSETTANFEVDKGVYVGVNQGVDVGVDSSDINTKTKTEIKTQTKLSSFPGGEPPGQKKESLPFWQKFVDTWDEKYKEKTDEAFVYLDKDFNHLKLIYKFLEKRAAAKQMVFNEENLVGAFKFFLNKAWEKDDWLRKNFTVSNVLSQFNAIANGKSDSNTKQATGSAVSTGSILSKINAMPD